MVPLGTIDDLSALDVLDPVERERLRQYHDGRLAEYDNLYLQYKSGFLDEGYYSVRVVNTVRNLAPLWTELGLLRLGAENPRVSKNFATEVERILSMDK